MSAVLRKSILIIVLMLLATAFAYDQFVVKPRPVRVQAELMDLVNDTSHTYSEDEIRSIVDRPFETIFESRQKKILKFSWRGLSSNPHDLYVVFRKFRGSTLISDVSLTEPSASKPFINPNDVADSMDVGHRGPEVRDGDVPEPAPLQGRGGLIDGS